MKHGYAFSAMRFLPLALLATLSTPASAQCQTGLRPIGVGNSTIPFQYVAGMEYALIEGIGSGNYEFLDFSSIPCNDGPCGASSGAALMQCLVTHGLGCCVDVGWSAQVQTGVSIGPVVQAVDALFSNDTNQTEYPASQTNTYPIYMVSGGNGSRVLPLPLVQFSVLPGGNRLATVNGFIGFFLKRRFLGGQHIFYGEFVPIPEVPVPTTRSTWGALKLIYR